MTAKLHFVYKSTRLGAPHDGDGKSSGCAWSDGFVVKFRCDALKIKSNYNNN